MVKLTGVTNTDDLQKYAKITRIRRIVGRRQRDHRGGRRGSSPRVCKPPVTHTGQRHRRSAAVGSTAAAAALGAHERGALPLPDDELAGVDVQRGLPSLSRARACSGRTCT
jgi:hypothetical protein